MAPTKGTPDTFIKTYLSILVIKRWVGDDVHLILHATALLLLQLYAHERIYMKANVHVYICI
jgi:hypothetical protein